MKWVYGLYYAAKGIKGMKNLSTEELSCYKAELEKLPIGSISRKKIAGKTRYYRQWVEAGQTKSVYLKESEVEDVRRQIERRRELVKLLRPKYIEVIGKFAARGGISIDPYVNGGVGAKYRRLAESRFAAWHGIR